MGTVIRAKLSERNKYWVEKHRHYELKHFCLQYPIWKKSYSEIDGMDRLGECTDGIRNNLPGDPTFKSADRKLYLHRRIELIEQVAIEADPDLASYILKGVTEGLSYAHLKARLEIPCSKDMYYDRYRRFFWILNKARD